MTVYDLPIEELMRSRGMNDVLPFGGGIIPQKDIPFPQQQSVEQVFPPCSFIGEIAARVRAAGARRRGNDSKA